MRECGTADWPSPVQGRPKMSAKYFGLEQDTEIYRTSFRDKLDQFFGSWYSRLAIFCLLLLTFLSLLWVMYPQATGSQREKQGAGLLFVADRQILLLLRNSKHNDRTWGLPGGNVEPGDADRLATATREASEELGGLPEFDVLTEIATKRGKRQQKHYTVFVCNMTSPNPEGFKPSLNAEHHSFQWFGFKEASRLKNLHPVVALLFREPAKKMLAAAVAAEPPQFDIDNKVQKRGAGLWLMSNYEVLLLTRNSTNNNDTLSVPGGNVDLDDTHLMATAEREAIEEMGGYPEFEALGEVDTVREGKHGSKEFKLFLGRVSAEAKDSFSPTLSHESLRWGWYPLAELQSRTDLHPVVRVAVEQHLDEILAAFSPSQEEAAVKALTFDEQQGR